MEYLDIYDEFMNHIGVEERGLVHKEGLWHKTIHCWLYDKEGNIYFQKRTDTKTLYTTASGHVSAGESLNEAFGREIKEEIGLSIDYEKAELLNVVIWTMDKEKGGEIVYKDRVFANVYTCLFDGDINNFSFDLNEVLGVVRVNANEVLDLFNNKVSEIDSSMIIYKDSKNEVINQKLEISDFLVNDHETLIGKYGKILEKVIEKSKQNI